MSAPTGCKNNQSKRSQEDQCISERCPIIWLCYNILKGFISQYSNYKDIPLNQFWMHVWILAYRYILNLYPHFLSEIFNDIRYFY